MYQVTTPKQMGQSDRYMIEFLGIPGMVLMENAAQAVCCNVLEALKQRRGPVWILCGGGNNGGDGLAILRQLAMRGIPARAALFCAPERLRGDALENYRIACGSCLDVAEVATEETLEKWWEKGKPSIVVDALFGTGLKREVSGIFAQAIELANAADAWRIAVDIPSGIDGETGAVLGAAFRAHETVTFQFAKRGHLLFPGREFTGKLSVAPIGPLKKPAGEQPEEMVLEQQDVAAMLPPRMQNAHKGNSGRGLLVAGSPGFCGAAQMSGASALRSGCGLLTIAAPKGVCPSLSSLYEAMTLPASKEENWDESSPSLVETALQKATAAAIGPGLGSGDAVEQLVCLALKWRGPLVVDADGLNALAHKPEMISLLHDRVILTPHPGELSRLLGRSTTRIAAAPVAAAKEAVQRFGCTVLLKGATSVIVATDGRIAYNLTGNPGLAKGGSGDVLTGILLALLCQQYSPFEAAKLGSYLLGQSAANAMELLGNRVLMAGDVIDVIRATVQRGPVCDMINK